MSAYRPKAVIVLVRPLGPRVAKTRRVGFGRREGEADIGNVGSERPGMAHLSYRTACARAAEVSPRGYIG